MLYSTDDDSAVYTGDGVSGVIVTGRQLVINGPNVILPYVATTSTTETRAADIASIPMENNMPVNGQPFSVVVDCAVPSDNQVITTVWRSGEGGNQENGYVALTRRYGYLCFGVSDGTRTTVDALESSQTSGDKHRITTTYDGYNLILYVDGAEVGSNTLDVTPVINFESDLRFGSRDDGASVLNSYLKNFRIIHRALSAAEVAALGSAE